MKKRTWDTTRSCMGTDHLSYQWEGKGSSFGVINFTNKVGKNPPHSGSTSPCPCFSVAIAIGRQLIIDLYIYVAVTGRKRTLA